MNKRQLTIIALTMLIMTALFTLCTNSKNMAGKIQMLQGYDGKMYFTKEVPVSVADDDAKTAEYEARSLVTKKYKLPNEAVWEYLLGTGETQRPGSTYNGIENSYWAYAAGYIIIFPDGKTINGPDLMPNAKEVEGLRSTDESRLKKLTEQGCLLLKLESIDNPEDKSVKVKTAEYWGEFKDMTITVRTTTRNFIATDWIDWKFVPKNEGSNRKYCVFFQL